MDLDEFSDDGFDSLPDNALQELENHAIQFTQANQSHAHAHAHGHGSKARYAGHGWEEDDDLDTTEVTNDAGVAVGRPVVDKTLRQPTQQTQKQHRGPQPPPAARPRPPLPNPQWNPTINLTGAPRAQMSNATRPRNQPFSGSQSFPVHGAVGPIHPQSTQFAPQSTPSSQATASNILTALQRRVRTLEAELHTARGEASILRSNTAKAHQEYDAQISRLKKLNAEQVAKYERTVEAALAAEQSANTELQFLQRDMKEVNDRARRKEPAAAVGAGSLTPRKTNKTWGVADGFDEMDIVVSPSKGQGRGKNAGGSVAMNVGERTPSKGKRKRPMVDSPIRALETHAGGLEMVEEDNEAASKTGLLPSIIAVPAAPFDFLQLVLGHGFARGQPSTFDILSRFAFPSDPSGTSISTMIFDKLPLLGNSHLPMQLLADFALQIISLWTRCYEEHFWDPIQYLISLIVFTFQLHTSSVAPIVFKELIPIAQSTIFLVAEGPQRLPDGTITNADEYSFLEQHIDTTQILSLLYATALTCAATPSETKDGGLRYTAAIFWSLMFPETVRLLLAPKQRAVDIIGMLNLLGTSSLPDSIGPIVDGKDAVTAASDVIDRVSAKLTEHSRAPNTPEQKRSIRLAALKTLVAFARHPFGARQLASHKDALPRLVICLSASIDDLYDQPLPPSTLPLPDSINKSSSLKIPTSKAPHELYRIISQCVLLIHALITDPLTAELADISGKLSLCHGGSQRYLIALGRLAFAEEDLVIEAGIEGEIVEAAHELLEMAVTPEEGETVSEAFGA